MNAVAECFSQAANHYDAIAGLQQQVADELLANIPIIQPQRIVDMGAGTGYLANKLQQCYPSSQVLAIDVALGMLQYAQARGRVTELICADARDLPLATDSCDLMLSSLMLQWCHPLAQTLASMQRVMSSGALLGFSTFGENTLAELRQSWRAVDSHAHVNEFLNEQQCLAALAQAGFSVQSFSSQIIVQHYPQLRHLLQELRSLGANHVLAGRSKGLLSRSRWQQLNHYYECYADRQAGLPATFEVFYLWAVKS